MSAVQRIEKTNMPITLNAGSLQISEGGATADETAALTAAFYDAATAQAFNNLQSNAYTFSSNLSPAQVAVDTGLFNIAANTKDLMFSSAATHTTFSTTVGVDSGLTTIDNQKVWLFAAAEDGDIIVGRVGADSNAAANSSIAFAVALDEKVSGVDGYVTEAQLWIRQHAPLIHADGAKVESLDVRTLTNKLFISSVESVQGTVSAFSTANSGAAIYTLQDGPGNVNVLVTALNSDNGGTAAPEDFVAERVNISTTGFGVANQGIDPGEGLRFDYVFGGALGGGSSASGINYSEHAELFNAGFGVVKFNGNATTATVKMTVQDAVPPGEDSANFFTDLGAVAGGITVEAVRIKDASGAVVHSGGNTPGAVQGMTVTGVGTGSVTVTGLQLNWTAEVVNKTKAFDRLIVENVGTSSFDIGKLITTTPPTVSTTSVELGAKIEMFDGGPTVTGSADAVPLSVGDGGGSNSASPSFTTNFGPDGPSTSSALAYSLRIDSTATGLKSGGLDVVLWKDSSGVVHGSTTTGNAATDVFTVTSSGGTAFVELTMLAGKAIDHAVGVNTATISGALSIVANATDRDGDTASAARSLTLNFGDAGPSITAGSAVSLESRDGSSVADTEAYSFTAESYGGDGAGTTTTALEIVNTNTGLKSGGVNITLEAGAGGSIVGKAGSTTVFTVGVSGNNVTLNQAAPIDHAAGSGVATLQGAMKITRTVTDRDGDATSASNEVNLSFNDGLPMIGGGTAVNLESTDGSTATDSKAFSFTLQSYGPDGAGTTSDALIITNANTGLTSGGTAVVLSMDGGNVVGMAGSARIFTVSLSGTNAVLDQDGPIDHTPGFDMAQIGGLSVQRTVTDYDGDQEIASTAINLVFNDTSPTITAGSPVALESTDGSVATDTKAFTFSGESYSGDGAGTTTTALEIIGGGSTHLTAGGVAISLSMSGNDVVGMAGSTKVFTVSLSGNNIVLDQDAAIDNASGADILNGAIWIKRTITDADGDITSASNAVNLTFKDSDPTVTGSTAMSLTTSDATPGTEAKDAGITHNLGADGGSFAYSLQGSGATTLTSGGKAISLALVDGKVVGQVAGGGAAFTVSVDSAGKVTLDQDMAIDHAPGSDTISLNGAISLVGTATDGDGDKASANQAINLTFTDDKATISVSGTKAGTLSTSDGALNVASAAVSFGVAFTAANYGADGGGSTVFAFDVKNAASGLTTVNNKAVTLSTANDGKTLVGTEVGGAKAFEVTLDAGGNATMTQLIAIKHAAGASEQSLAAGSVSIVATATDSDKDAASASVDVSGSIKVMDVTASFVGLDSMVGSVNTATGAGAVRYVQGAKHTDTFSVDWQNDAPGVLSIASFDAYTANGLTGLKGVQVGNTLYYNYTTSLDPTVKPVFTVAFTDNSYTVEMVNAPKGLPQMIAFDKLPSGSPTEKVTANLSGSYGGSVTIDGLIFDQKSTATDPWKMLDPKKNGAAATDDDINTNNIGFGIKGGQASQINPGEGFQLAYNPPAGGGASTGGVDHLSKLSFDVYGIGNITGVKASYWLYLNGADGKAGTADDILVDTGSLATTGLLTDGKAHNVVLKDDGTGAGQHGGIFDSVVVRFDFSGDVDKKTGLVDQNQGVRVGTFYTEITHAADPDSFGFTLQATDIDGDITQQLVAVGLHPTDGWLI